MEHPETRRTADPTRCIEPFNQTSAKKELHVNGGAIEATAKIR